MITITTFTILLCWYIRLFGHSRCLAEKKSFFYLEEQFPNFLVSRPLYILWSYSTIQNAFIYVEFTPLPLNLSPFKSMWLKFFLWTEYLDKHSRFLAVFLFPTWKKKKSQLSHRIFSEGCGAPRALGWKAGGLGSDSDSVLVSLCGLKQGACLSESWVCHVLRHIQLWKGRCLVLCHLLEESVIHTDARIWRKETHTHTWLANPKSPPKEDVNSRSPGLTLGSAITTGMTLGKSVLIPAPVFSLTWQVVGGYDDLQTCTFSWNFRLNTVGLEVARGICQLDLESRPFLVTRGCALTLKFCGGDCTVLFVSRL